MCFLKETSYECLLEEDRLGANMVLVPLQAILDLVPSQINRVWYHCRQIWIYWRRALRIWCMRARGWERRGTWTPRRRPRSRRTP